MSERSMEFTYDESQQALADAAAGVFAGHSTDERVVASERDGTAYDERLWEQAIKGGLLDAVLPEAADGGGLGVTGLAIVLGHQGRHLSRLPLACTAIAAMTLAEFSAGDDALLSEIRAGKARVAIATPESWDGVRASRDGAGWVLSGSLQQVYMAGSCTHLLLVARHDGEEAVFLLQLGRDIEPDNFEGISRNRHAAFRFDDVRVDDGCLIGDASSARWLTDRWLVSLAALQWGICAEALRRTAAYVSTRMQFGRPLSTNQGVAIRAADAYNDAEAIRLTMFNAAWHLDAGCETTRETLIATWWAREAGSRIVHATQHLHGGAGADVDNHIHRFFLWARELDLVGGPAAGHLGSLGDLYYVGSPR